MKIQQECMKDYEDVYQLIKESFATAEHSDGTEQDLVEKLRQSMSFIPELSLVAKIDKKVVGHILFTKAYVGKDEVLVLAPLSVHPQYQKKGIGTKLVTQGHALAKKLEYSYSLVLGSYNFYSKFGYTFADTFGIEIPSWAEKEYFLATKLREESSVQLCGKVTYAKEFNID